MKKFIIPALVMALALTTGCTLADKFEYGKEGILITGTDASPMAKTRIVADAVPISYSFSVSSTGKVDADTKVYLKIDSEAVEAYNAKNGTSYVAVPESALTLEDEYLTISEGKATSNVTNVVLTDNSFIQDGVLYVIAISATKVEGADVELIESSKTVYIKLGKTQQNPALDINSTSVYSTYSFGTGPTDGYDVNNWTLEIKAYPYNMKKRGSEQLCRLCCWNEDGGGQVLLRFNENGKPWKTLDIVSVSGRYVTGTSGEGDNATGFFEENTWYLISIVWDGAQMKVYVNGELDTPWQNTISGSQAFKINRFEIGMSWGGYGNSQSYTGRMAEMRIWDRARSQSEIAEGLCSVDPASEGLLGYWRFNEGSGTVFHDTAAWDPYGNKTAKDMDWAQSMRQADEKTYTNTGAGSAVRWVKDEKNNCLQ